jgi:hypothetical protein
MHHITGWACYLVNLQTKSADGKDDGKPDMGTDFRDWSGGDLRGPWLTGTLPTHPVAGLVKLSVYVCRQLECKKINRTIVMSATYQKIPG